MRKFTMIMLAVFLAGCAVFGNKVDEESIPAIEKVVVMSYGNITEYDYLTETVQKYLETDLAKITRPKFILYDEALERFPAIEGMAQDELRSPEKRRKLAESLDADAVLLCRVTLASYTEPSEDDEPGGFTSNVEKVPTGRPDGGEKIKSMSFSFRSEPEPSASVSVLIDIVDLKTGKSVYSVVESSSESRKGASQKGILDFATIESVSKAIRCYRWPGLEG
ncbi:hypothetical protein ACFL6S_06550 [Candidatus Poribacteria bacterium]